MIGSTLSVAIFLILPPLRKFITAVKAADDFFNLAHDCAPFLFCAFFTVDFLDGCDSSSVMRAFKSFISFSDRSDFLFQKFCTRHELPRNLVLGDMA
jgi:hypothetical protein